MATLLLIGIIISSRSQSVFFFSIFSLNTLVTSSQSLKFIIDTTHCMLVCVQFSIKIMPIGHFEWAERVKIYKNKERPPLSTVITIHDLFLQYSLNAAKNSHFYCKTMTCGFYNGVLHSWFAAAAGEGACRGERKDTRRTIINEFNWYFITVMCAHLWIEWVAKND